MSESPTTDDPQPPELEKTADLLRQVCDTGLGGIGVGEDVFGPRRETGASAHPFYWAGLVAAGDWR